MMPSCPHCRSPMTLVSQDGISWWQCKSEKYHREPADDFKDLPLLPNARS